MHHTSGGSLSPRERLAVWCAAVIPFLVLGAVQWHWFAPVGADDYGQYLSHAKALLDGRAYTDIGYLYTPLNSYIGPWAEPPGLPWTLVPVLALFGPAEWALRALMLVSAALGIGFAGEYLAREDGWRRAAAVALLSGVALQLERATVPLGSDVGFIALVWAACLLADTRARWGAGRVVALCAVGSMAVLYRLAAVPLIPAAVVFAALHWREQRWRPLVPAAVWTATAVLMQRALHAADAIGGAMADKVMPTHEITPVRAVRFGLGFVLYLVQGARYYLTPLFEAETYPFASKYANAGFHVLFTIVAALGLVVWLRRGGWRTFLGLFAGAYAAMLILSTSKDGRYIWPLIPLVAYAGLLGVDAIVAAVIARRARGRASIDASPARPARGGAGIAALVTCAVLAAVTHGRERGLPALRDLPDGRALWTEMARIGRESAPAGGARALIFVPRSLTWDTGIPAMGPFNAPPETVMRVLRENRINYVVLGDVGVYDDSPEVTGSIAAVVTAHPDAFTRVWANPSFAVYHLAPPAVVAR